MMTFRRSIETTLIILTFVCGTALVQRQKAFAEGGCQAAFGGAARCTSASEPGDGLPKSTRPTGASPAAEYVEEATNCGAQEVALRRTPWAGNPGCRNVSALCPVAPGSPVDPTKQIHVVQVFDRQTNQFIRNDVDCNFSVGPPMPSMAAIKAEATKYAPRPKTASGGTRYLVNAAVVFYATPPAGLTDLVNVAIPRFTLSGHTFDVRLSLVKSVWFWGDGGSDEIDASGGHAFGTPYDDGHPCESSSSCTDYIAHVYRAPGNFTVTASARWAATYALDGSAQQVPIPGELLTTDPTGRTVAVHEAHSVLVAPN
jgi:hypothetical protein